MNEIKEHLDKAQNPIFYYDNDADGLCSFLIFRRYLGRGKGVAVRSYPELNAKYARKAQELNADYVFVLDKPVVAREFVEEINKIGLPLVWIDHHDIVTERFEKEFDNFFVFNSKKEPVTYLAYKIVNRKEDIWIALMGCVADHYMPDFASEFASEYPDYWAKNVKEPFDVYYKTEIGKIAQALNFGLKDSITHVVQLQSFLISCKGPGDVLLEAKGNNSFRQKNKEIREKYSELLEKARKEEFGRLIFFVYGGELSISAGIANELSYFFRDKYICVGYKNGEITNFSLRGKGVKRILARVIEGFEGASGGGHDDAVGARIRTGDLGRFRDLLIQSIDNNV